MDIELLKIMDPGHAINSLRADFDPLVNTPLEAFLIDWIESLVDTEDSDAPLIEAAAEHDLEPEGITKLGDALIEDTDNTVAILGAIGEAGIDRPESLKAELELANKFRALASDAGDVFTRLTSLIEQEQ